MTTVFDKIISGDLPSAKIYEDDIILAFMDAFPQTNGHCLIIPKSPQPDLLSMPDDELHHIIVFSKRLAKAVNKALAPDGIRIMQFNGEAAGQTVFHYHMHVMPMWNGQAPKAHADEKAVSLDELQKTADLIRQALDEQ